MRSTPSSPGAPFSVEIPQPRTSGRAGTSFELGVGLVACAPGLLSMFIGMFAALFTEDGRSELRCFHPRSGGTTCAQSFDGDRGFRADVHVIGSVELRTRISEGKEVHTLSLRDRATGDTIWREGGQRAHLEALAQMLDPAIHQRHRPGDVLERVHVLQHNRLDRTFAAVPILIGAFVFALGLRRRFLDVTVPRHARLRSMLQLPFVGAVERSIEDLPAVLRIETTKSSDGDPTSSLVLEGDRRLVIRSEDTEDIARLLAVPRTFK